MDLDQDDDFIVCFDSTAIRFKMLTKGRTMPLQYWQSDGAAWPDLQKFGVKLFTLAKASASSERNFSTMGIVYSKLRNSLRTETVGKLVYIKTNYPTFADCLHVSDSEGMPS
jgi:hypothetical protein